MYSTLTVKFARNWSFVIELGYLNGLKKAFDNIDHRIMLQKLAKYGYDQNALEWFASYLTNRMQTCKINNHLPCTSQSVNCGVPH